MIGYFRDRWRSASLKAQYERMVQERLLSLVEETGPQRVAEDPGQWSPLGQTGGIVDESERGDLRSKARRMMVESPHARNIIRLLEIYVVGPGLMVSHGARQPDTDEKELAVRADAIWQDFLTANRRHFSYREYGRRAWRDGECFLRVFSDGSGVPSVRFIDPETIATPAHMEPNQGIVTRPDDVESPLAYLRIDPASQQLEEEIAAEEVLHTKIGVDSNQKRGITILAPVIEALTDFEKWLETELTARKLQSSIVLWRKIQGSPSDAAAFADRAKFDTRNDMGESVRRERVRAGTILTTSQGTDLQFLHPNTNFGDAVPLGRLLLLCIAAGQGLPEFMLTSDASNGSFASTMVAEGPAVKLFQAEQQFFIGEFEALRRQVMSAAMRAGLLPDDALTRLTAHWSVPQLVNRDRPRERLADARLIDAGVLSRAEVARRDGADPEVMEGEREKEEGRRMKAEG